MRINHGYADPAYLAWRVQLPKRRRDRNLALGRDGNDADPNASTGYVEDTWNDPARGYAVGTLATSASWHTFCKENEHDRLNQRPNRRAP
jgi:hypothetical protein